MSGCDDVSKRVEMVGADVNRLFRSLSRGHRCGAHWARKARQIFARIPTHRAPGPFMPSPRIGRRPIPLERSVMGGALKWRGLSGAPADALEPFP